MNLWQELKEESRNLVENYRTLAQKGMGTESEKDARVGLELDFYDSKGNKQFGKIVKKDRKGYTVKDEKGKTHTFVFLDRQKAKKLLTKTDKLSNIIKKNTIKKGKFAGYMTDEVEEAVSPAQQAAIAIAKKEKGEKPIDEDFMSFLAVALPAYIGVSTVALVGLIASEMAGIDIVGKAEKTIENIKSKFKRNKNYKPSKSELETLKKVGQEIKKKDPSAYKKAQQKVDSMKESRAKNESVMDTYRQMWEDGQKYAPQLDEEVANITVDPKNKIPTPAGQNKHSLEIVKQARRFGIKASQLGKHIRIKGNKKAVNDFLRIVIGKSSYGDPTEKDTSTPQIDKMLSKGLK